MVVLPRVLCEGLDQHHVSLNGKLCSGMRSGAGGIPHVVETIKETDQVEGSGVTVGAGHLERHIVEAESGRCGAGRLNRWRMKVKAGKCALRKGARHAHRRCAVAAANIGNHDSCVQAVGPAGQRRHPLLDEEMVVGGAEQLLGALKKVMVMFAPSHCSVPANRLNGLVEIEVERLRAHESSRHPKW